MIGWLRANLFNSALNSCLTVLLVLVLLQVVPAVVRWAFLDCLWFSSGQECSPSPGRAGRGGQECPFHPFRLLPLRAALASALSILILCGLFVLSGNRRWWNRGLFIAWGVGLAVMGVLMAGGVLGLPWVEPARWSGICLTLVLSLFGLTAAYPLGVILALGRQSRLPVIKSLCVVYIELIRGVPLISLLFMASVMFPLFLPEGFTVDKILRAQLALILFTAAYIAEVVRGAAGDPAWPIRGGRIPRAGLRTEDAAHRAAPGPEDRDPTHGEHPHFGIQGHIPRGHHRPLRPPQDHAGDPGQSGMARLQRGGLCFHFDSLLFGLLFHVQPEPTPGKGPWAGMIPAALQQVVHRALCP